MKTTKFFYIHNAKLFILIGWYLLVQSTNSTAQLCNGSLGDPIVNITFGSGNVTLPDGVTSFEYTGGCPEKGQYTIDHFLFGCGEKTWHAAIGDHTGDHDGNYMLINAESTPGIIHKETATELCGNTTYQYSAWIANMMQSFTCGGHAILPDITFTIQSISGATLATYNTGNLPILDSKTWNQYGLSFKIPPDVDAVILTISTKPAFGCGSAFAIDDITFSECGPSVNATIDGSPGPADVCADYSNPFLLNGSYTPGFSDPVVQWQNSLDTVKTWNDIPGENTTTYAVPRRTSGVILYRMAVAERANINSKNCRTSSNSIYTEIHPLAEHKPPENIIGCLNKDLHLPKADPKALDVQWTEPNGFLSKNSATIIPNIQNSDTGLYKLQETFYFGCVSLDSFYLGVFPSTTISAVPLYSVCEGMSKTLSVSATGGGSFKWTPSLGLSNDTIANPVAMPLDSTKYKVVLTNSFGCKDSAQVNVNVYRYPMVNAGTDKIIVSGDSITLDASVKGTAVNFSWSPSLFMSNSGIVNPVVYPSQDISYTLNAVSTIGCGTVADQVNIKVYNAIFIPNAFSPNGDGINDKFEIPAFDNYKPLRLLIYNRFGNLVFKSANSYQSWDGTFKDIPQPVGAYVYYLKLQNPKGRVISKQGTIFLTR